MRLFGEHLSGWRKTGVIFLILIWTLTLLLLVLLVRSLHASGSWTDTTIFVGNCSQSDRNIFLLRLAINIVATAILTSSNFFLQTLVAPARKDIDKAHKRLEWLEVGVNSLRNLRFVTWPKLTLWLLIAVTSIPFHLIFNSSVYGADAQTNIIVTLASERFADGGKYSLPGIGWAISGYEYGWVESDDTSDKYLQEIEYIAQSAASWQRLDGPECFSAYNTTMLRYRRHLVVVLETDGQGDSLGWNYTDTKNDDMYSQYYISNNSNVPYTLWDAQNGTFGSTPTCCNAYFGNADLLSSNSTWTLEWPASQYDELEAILQQQQITAKYCLSEQIEGFCKSQVNNVLFFVVFLCGLGKSIFCTVTLVYLWHSRPIFTIGDAVQSFIRKPDVTTEGMCTFGWRNFLKKTDWTPTTRQWRSDRTRYARAVPTSYWLGVYIFSVVVLAAAFILFGVDVAFGFWSSPFGVNASDPATVTTDSQFNTIISGIVGASIISNLPQLVLSTLYLLFTSLISRIVQAKEWALMSVSYQPLRVNEPKANQVSPWLFQLPLFYLIPLQVIGITLHVLASNSLYVYVLELHSPYHLAPPSDVLSRDISMDFSPKAELVAICTYLVALSIPVMFSLTNLPGRSVVVGNSSAAISAACHVTWRSGEEMDMPRASQDNSTDSPQQEAGYPMMSLSEDMANLRRGIESRVQQRLKWGVVAEKVVFLASGRGDSQPVGHLSFGTEEEDVRCAVDGAFYAGDKCVSLQ